MLVEDHAALAEAVAELLQEQGFEVRTTGSGSEALKVAKVFLPDIVLCDLRLPDTSGLNLAEAIRASRDTTGVLFVIHSALDDASMRSLQNDISADLVNLFLPKPLTKQRIDLLLEKFSLWQRSRPSPSGLQGRRKRPAGRGRL